MDRAVHGGYLGAIRYLEEELDALLSESIDAGGGPDLRRLAGHSPRRPLGPEGTAPRGQVVGEATRGTSDNPDNPTTPTDPKTVLDDTLHVIVTGRSAGQAYAHRADTAEVVDLASDPAGRDRFLGWVVSRMQTSGAIWRLRGSEPPPLTSLPGAQ